jgi:hypothetical protein
MFKALVSLLSGQPRTWILGLGSGWRWMGSFNGRLLYPQRKSSRYRLVRTLGCAPYLSCIYRTSQGLISDEPPELCGPLPKLATFCTLPHTKETNNSLLLLNFFSFSAPPTAFKLSTPSRKRAHCLPSRKLSHVASKLQPKSRLPGIKADCYIIPNSLRNGVAFNLLITDASLTPDSNRTQVLRKTRKTIDNCQHRNIVTQSENLHNEAGQCCSWIMLVQKSDCWHQLRAVWYRPSSI